MLKSIFFDISAPLFPGLSATKKRTASLATSSSRPSLVFVFVYGYFSLSFD